MNVRTAALLGTDRSPELTPDTLLDAIARDALRGLAGAPLVEQTPSAAPALPAENRPICSIPAVVLLRQIVEKQPLPLLLALLRHVDQRDQRVPHPDMPALLARAKKERGSDELRLLLASVGGRFGEADGVQRSMFGYAIGQQVTGWRKKRTFFKQLEEAIEQHTVNVNLQVLLPTLTQLELKEVEQVLARLYKERMGGALLDSAEIYKKILELP